MLYKLDESVGRVTQALQEHDMLQNSIIVFTTDNGGPAAGFNLNHASNWPLKGVRPTFSSYPFINVPFKCSVARCLRTRRFFVFSYLGERYPLGRRSTRNGSFVESTSENSSKSCKSNDEHSRLAANTLRCCWFVLDSSLYRFNCTDTIHLLVQIV